jgi:DNA-binding NarL/FixJ family response regulator
MSAERSLPMGAAMNVAVSVRNDLVRYGLTGMLQSVDIVGVAVSVRNDLVRDGLTGRLQPVDIVGEVVPGHDVASATDDVARSTPVDVLIVDSAEASMLGHTALSTVKANGVKVLWLIDEAVPYDNDQLGLLLLGGCVATSQLNPSSLRDALWRTYHGEPVLPGSLVETLVDFAGRAGPPPERPRPSTAVRITPREREALGLLVEGLGNKQIARKMGISVHGAKRLVANILAKLDCTNRTHAVAKVLREGWYEESLVGVDC